MKAPKCDSCAKTMKLTGRVLVTMPDNDQYYLYGYKCERCGTFKKLSDKDKK